MTTEAIAPSAIEAEKVTVQERLRSLGAATADVEQALSDARERRADLVFSRDVRGLKVGKEMTAVEGEITRLRDDLIDRAATIDQAHEYLKHIERPLLEARLVELRGELERQSEGHPHLHRDAMAAIRAAVEAAGAWTEWHRREQVTRSQHDRLAERLGEPQWTGPRGPAVLIAGSELTLASKALNAKANPRDIEAALRAVDRRIEHNEARY